MGFVFWFVLGFGWVVVFMVVIWFGFILFGFLGYGCIVDFMGLLFGSFVFLLIGFVVLFDVLGASVCWFYRLSFGFGFGFRLWCLCFGLVRYLGEMRQFLFCVF